MADKIQITLNESLDDASDDSQQFLKQKNMLRRKSQLQSYFSQTDEQSLLNFAEKIAKAKDKQMDASSKILEKVSDDSSQLVSNVKRAILHDEIATGKHVEERRKRRIEKLERESIVGSAHFREISSKWEELIMLLAPSEMHLKLMEQKSLCDAVINEKNQLIKELLQEIFDTENEFEKGVERQECEIEITIDRCRQQVHLLTKCYNRQLTANKDVQASGWTELFESSKTEFGEALERFESNESERLRTFVEMFDAWETKLDELSHQKYMEFVEARKESDKNIEILHLKLQEMKSALQLNREKLEYGFQLLRKREDEQMAVKTQQRRQITKLYNAVAKLKTEVAKREKNNRHLNNLRNNVPNSQYKHFLYVKKFSIKAKEKQKVIEYEFRKMMEQVETNDRKFNHVRAVEETKFNEMWKMNNESARELVKKLQEINRQIDEDILGHSTQQLTTPFYANDDKVTSKIISKRKVMKPHTVFRLGLITARRRCQKRNRSRNFELSQILASKVMNTLLENMIEVASDLIADAHTENITDNLSQQQKLLIKLDAVFTALQIEKDEEIDALLHLLYNKCVRQPTDEHANHTINKQNILQTIQEFLENRNNNLRLQEYYSKARKSVSSPQITVREIEDYWQQYTQLVPQSKLALWDNLCRGLNKLRLVKVETKVYEKENQKLRKQNEELQRLLTPFIQIVRAPA